MANVIKPENRRGLVGYWKYHGNVSALGTVYGLSGNGNNGTLNGDAFIDNQGINFNGSSDYINLGRPSSLSSMNTGTISMWVKLNLLSGGSFVFGRDLGGANSGDINIHYNADIANRWVFVGVSGVTTKSVESNSIGNLNWVHIVATWNGTTMYLYIDGVQQSDNASLTTNLMTVSTDITIGALRVGPIAPFNGIIDNVQIYNRGLSEPETKLLYHTTRRF